MNRCLYLTDIKRRLFLWVYLSSLSPSSVLLIIFDIIHSLQVFIMGRTIPSFRIATVLEEKERDNFRKYLIINNSNKNYDKKIFKRNVLNSKLYNSACSNAGNPIRIHPIMMSIILHHYKMLKERELDR